MFSVVLFRDENGSIYLQTLAQFLKEEFMNLSLERILTLVKTSHGRRNAGLISVLSTKVFVIEDLISLKVHKEILLTCVELEFHDTGFRQNNANG